MLDDNTSNLHANNNSNDNTKHKLYMDDRQRCFYITNGKAKYFYGVSRLPDNYISISDIEYINRQNEFWQLVEANIPTAKKVVNRVAKQHSLYNYRDELFSDGAFIGLLKAAGNYNSQAGKFKPFAYRCCLNECYTWIRQYIVKQPETVSIESAITNSEENSYNISSELFAKLSVADIQDKLSDEEFFIVYNYYCLERTQQSIADELHVVKSAICERLKVIRNKLTQQIPND